MWTEVRLFGGALWHLVRPEHRCSWCEGSGNNRDGTACVWCGGGGYATRFADRNYELFSVLADVRNSDPPGESAPWKRLFPDYDQWNTEGDRVEPISDPRGFPDDLSDELRAWHERCAEDEDIDQEGPYGRKLAYLGDHSESWLLLSEVLAYFEVPRPHIERGMVPFDQWDDTWAERFYARSEEQLGYSRGVGGARTRIVSMDEARRIKAGAMPRPDAGFLYVRAEWTVDLRRQIGPTFLDHFVPACLALAPSPGDVRLVFNFDS